MNRLLLRQINKYLEGLSETPEGFQKFLEVISESYDHYERDRKMLERSIELTSAEMIELNGRLRKETEEGSKEIFEKLKESLEILNDEEVIISQPDFLKLSHVAEILKNETRKRRIAEQALAKRATYLEASQRIAHIGSWELELNDLNVLSNNKLTWSDETYRIFGYAPGSVHVTNDLFLSHVHSDDKTLVQESVGRALWVTGTYELEHRIVLANGAKKIVHGLAEVIYNDGKAVCMIGTVQDITSQKEAEQKLEHANRALATLFENMQEAYFTVDMRSYQVTQMSPACENVYGYPAEDFYTNPNLWFDLVLEEDKPAITANDPILRNGQTIVNTYRGKEKNGRIKWLESKIIPTLDENNNLIRIDGVTSDITVRIEYIEALKRSNEELQKSNSELDRFVYSVTHDLRAPLSSMQGVIELLRSETDDPLILKDVGMLKTSINKLDSFILDILDYSRNARLGVNTEHIDFNGLLNDTIEHIKFINAGNRRIDVRTNIDAIADFYSDKGRLAVVFNNLLSNAFRYSDPDRSDPFVSVSIHTSDSGAEIIITDNGLGIDKENAPKVFDMFYRVSKKSVGSGLGLYIVKETVEKLKGSISLESELGVGTAFRILLPNLLNP
jgi:PAS domain S-box-containing protein